MTTTLVCWLLEVTSGVCRVFLRKDVDHLSILVYWSYLALFGRPTDRFVKSTESSIPIRSANEPQM